MQDSHLQHSLLVMPRLREEVAKAYKYAGVLEPIAAALSFSSAWYKLLPCQGILSIAAERKHEGLKKLISATALTVAASPGRVAETFA